MTAVTIARGASTTWHDLRANRPGYTFTWQDLDGLHWTSDLPSDAPYTSLLHGWSADGTTLVRIRLDGVRVREAVLRPRGGESATLVVPEPWGARETRVAQLHSPDGVTADVVPAQVEVPDTGNGALVFLVPQDLVVPWQ